MNIEFEDKCFLEALDILNQQQFPARTKIGIFVEAYHLEIFKFYWFNDNYEIIDFILNTWIPTLVEDRHPEYYEFVNFIVGYIKKTSVQLDELIEATNENPFVFDRIVWNGMINDLIKTDSRFAIELRRKYCESNNCCDLDSDEFISFLEEYGCNFN